MAEIVVDATIVGGGPVGLLLALQLVRSGCSVHIVDRDDKRAIGSYGRANVLYSRSIELLDQLGLAEDLLQQCYICRDSYTYDANGNQVIPSRVWNFIENIDDSNFDFALMLRQQFIELCLQKRLREEGVELNCSAECIGFIHYEPDLEGYRVLSNFKRNDALYSVKSKFLIGADGGKSFVRRHLNVPFEGDTTQDKWIRVDGDVKCDIPNPRAYGSIESATHGNVLWAPLDHNVTRIGYVYTEEQERRYGRELSEEIVVQEAVQAMKPFHCEFQRVHWWTLYVIGQRVAATYCPTDAVILAGDACHTHSSGAAQGLNTGVHDAINLGWKLALVIKKLASPRLLDTYNSERRAAAQRLIAFDKNISSLVAGRWPAGMEATGDINKKLAECFDEATGYNTGLGIRYEENDLNVTHAAFKDTCSFTAGERAPDAQLRKPATCESIRLHKVTPNKAMFYVLWFAGDPRVTLPQLDELSHITRRTSSIVRDIIIVSADPKLSVLEALGTDPWGPVYMDDRYNAHKRYGISLRRGGIVVVRPDGIVATFASLSTAGQEHVDTYLKSVLACTDD